MNVLQINGYGLPGKRFNGLALAKYLKDYEIHSQHLVFDKQLDYGDSISDISYFGKKYTTFCNQIVKNIENKLSLQSILYPHSLQMTRKKEFKAADLIHYHIIHSGYLSLLALPFLSAKKPSVWTLHDPWALTGHCIHPFDCERWKIGCGSCPNLDSDFALKKDRTALLFKIKKKIYQSSKIDIIVASDFMFNMVKQSPLMSHLQVHQIPFGIDLNFFKPKDSSLAKLQLGIKPDSIVLAFRSVNNQFKGLEYIIQALSCLRTAKPVCLLTFNCKGLLNQFNNKYQIIELGWTNDEVLMRNAFNASDIFLMPSIAEAFGMMAVEAMACGKPVICFEGTALPKTTFAPDGGIAIPMRDGNAFTKAIENLIYHADERENRGRACREIAEKYYDINLQAQRIAKIYQSLAGEKR